MSVLNEKHFHNEAAAYKWVEARVWPNGTVCPHCGSLGRVYEIKGKTTRIGLKKCGACRKQFTVTVGTIFEDSHIPLNKWLMAIHLLCSSKKGMSAHQLHRMLGVTYKSAWFTAHRIRYAAGAGSGAGSATHHPISAQFAGGAWGCRGDGRRHWRKLRQPARSGARDHSGSAESPYLGGCAYSQITGRRIPGGVPRNGPLPAPLCRQPAPDVGP